MYNEFIGRVDRVIIHCPCRFQKTRELSQFTKKSSKCRFPTIFQRRKEILGQLVLPFCQECVFKMRVLLNFQSGLNMSPITAPSLTVFEKQNVPPSSLGSAFTESYPRVPNLNPFCFLLWEKKHLPLYRSSYSLCMHFGDSSRWRGSVCFTNNSRTTQVSWETHKRPRRNDLSENEESWRSAQTSFLLRSLCPPLVPSWETGDYELLSEKVCVVESSVSAN